MKVYLAAPYGCRDSLRDVAWHLRDIYGIDVTSGWLRGTRPVTPGTEGAATALSDETVSGYASGDLEDVARADVLVAFTPPTWTPGHPDRVLRLDGAVSTSGGRHVEVGFALALGKTVVVCGEPENVFHRMCQVYPNWDETLQFLLGYAAGLQGAGQ